MRKIYGYLFLFVFSVFGAKSSAQDYFCGKLVKTGIWKGHEVEYVEGQVSVIIKSHVEPSAIRNMLRGYNAKIVTPFDELGAGLVEIPDSMDVLSLSTEMEKNPLTKSAGPNVIIHGHFEPNDPYYLDGHQWALKNWGQNPPGGIPDADIDAPQAWNVTQGDPSVILAVLDSGLPWNYAIGFSHPDLDDPDRFIVGWNFISGNSDIRDNHGHGTHVTGIMAAEVNNNEGIAGIAGDCKVLIIKILNNELTSDWDKFYKGVKYAVDNGAHVINASIGAPAPNPKAELAVQYAYNHGVLLVVSSGNYGVMGVEWPAAYSTSYSNVVAVGATDYDDMRASYSNYGPELNVVAPGGAGDDSYPVDEGDIYSTTPNYHVPINEYPPYSTQNYGYLYGTSMSAPMVTGIAGLIFSVNPQYKYNATKVRVIIQISADDLGLEGRDNEYGWGRVNAYEAVRNLLVQISGPTQLEPAEIGTFTANAGGGSWTYTNYRWWKRNDEGMMMGQGRDDDILAPPPGEWIELTQYEGDQEIQVSSTYDFSLKCRVYDDQDHTAEDIHSVSVGYFRKALPFEAQTQKTPETFFVGQNFPNPFNPTTTIRYALAENARVFLAVYDIQGREIERLVDGEEIAGYKSATWDASLYGSGVYFYRMYITNNGKAVLNKTVKMLVVK